MTNAIAQVVKNATQAAAETKAAQAEKVVTRKARTSRKPQEKKAGQSAAVQAIKSLPVRYIITVRPAGGRQLKAFTRAWMELLGFLDGKEYPRKVLTAIAGDRAISYHTATQPNIEQGKDGLRMSAYGKEAFFPMRDDGQAYDRNDVDAYKEIMRTGKADGRLVKNAAILKSFSA